MIHNLKYRLACLSLTFLCAVPSPAQTWSDQTFESFSKGNPGAGGQNIYVSKKGELRTIRRFDLNNDGNIDLLFNSTHNDDALTPVTITSFSENGSITTHELPVQGSLASCVSDLNKDGYPDLVFCPNPSGTQSPRRFVTIAYGSEDGWTARRMYGLLPVNDVKSVVVADLNKDGWPDIVTLNSTAWRPNQPSGQIVRIYWGRTNGFSLDQFSDLGIEEADSMVPGDFDADGFDDIAIVAKHTLHMIWASGMATGAAGKFSPARTTVDFPQTTIQCITAADLDRDGKPDLLFGGENKSVYLLRNKGRRAWGPSRKILQTDASFLSVADLDGDGSTDLVVSRFSLRNALGGEMLGGKNIANNNVQVFWGDKGAFSHDAVTTLETAYTVATAIGDLNGDGLPDIICAVHQGEKLYAAESEIYYNKGARSFQKSSQGIPGSGAYHVTLVPTGKDKIMHAVIANSHAGNLNEEVPLLLYWGGPEGFSPDNRLEIPFTSGYEATAADFNNDGFVDLLAVNSMHSGIEGEWSRGINIFWGSPEGFRLDREGRTVLNEDFVSTSNVADLNKDGYLDLVIGFFGPYDFSTPTDLVIYYGSKNGFELKDRKTIPCKGRSSSPAIADYNLDGWLDIAVASYEENLLRVFWGGPSGFSENKSRQLELHSVIDLETADLNNDGYLDLIATSYKDMINNHHDTGVVIYWGGSDGFREWDAQWLPAATVLGPTVADFDGDGFLDLFCPSYHADLTREYLPMYLYWGGPEGFNPGNRTVLIGETGGTDALAADFDRDGKLDLAVSAHTLDGFHSKGAAKIYYNDGNRFKGPDTRITYLPSPGSHWMWNYDMGNIYNRKWEENYTSAVFDLDPNPTRGEIRCEADTPLGTRLLLYQRNASTREALPGADWEEVPNSSFAVHPASRFLQYKLVFVSDNGDRYPVVRKVDIQVK